MQLSNIINELDNLDINQLRILNGAVYDRLKSVRDRDSALKRRTLRAGDKVS